MLEVILSAVIIIQSIFHFIERRDMCNRIMSKDFTEYKQKVAPPKHIPSAHNRVLQKWRDKVGDE